MPKYASFALLRKPLDLIKPNSVAARTICLQMLYRFSLASTALNSALHDFCTKECFCVTKILLNLHWSSIADRCISACRRSNKS